MRQSPGGQFPEVAEKSTLNQLLGVIAENHKLRGGKGMELYETHWYL